MKIFVRIKPNSKIDKIETVGPKKYKVSVKAEAKEGRANERLAVVLAEYLNIPKKEIKILSGHKSRDKIIELKD